MDDDKLEIILENIAQLLKQIEENQEEQTQAVEDNTQAISDLIIALKPHVSNLSLILGNPVF